MAPLVDEATQLMHDLKNPLVTVALELQLLDRIGVPEAARASLDRIRANIGFLDRLVNELLDTRAQRAGALHLHKEPTRVAELIEHVLARAVSARDRARVELELDLDHSLAIPLDRLRIERVLCNLLHNALKYSPTPSRVVVHGSVTPHHARIEVTDGGPGLSSTELAVLFAQYTRLRPASHEGHGLGLFISRQIVEAHGGTIGARSTPGVGSCFYVELPRV